MKFHNFIITEGVIQNVIKGLKNLSYRQFVNKAEESIRELIDKLTEEGKEDEALKIINRAYKSNFKSFSQIVDAKPKLEESSIEDYWKIIKSELFPTLTFYPALSVWLEIDKLFKGSEPNMRIVIIYSLFWVALITGKFIQNKKEKQS